MSSFSSEALEFLHALNGNNSKEWFDANRKTYEREIKGPTKVFSKEMNAALAELTGDALKAKIFRINRDVRFSKDKTSYNAHLHISFMPDEGKGASPAWFFALEPEKLIFGAGAFGFSAPVLERVRAQIAAGEGKDLQTLLAKLTKNGVRLSEPELKRVPRGYDPDEPYAPLLRHKSLTAWRDITGSEIATRPGLIKRSMEEFRLLKPLVDWLSEI